MLEYITRYEFWLVLGFVLIAVDMLIGLEFFALAFGIAALLMGITLVVLGQMGINLNWEWTLIIFAVDSVVILVPLRRWLNKRRSEGGQDINDY